ncbi:LysR substrate-binding domain-containing protein [Pseudonocardia kunmingensis]|uniref:DNA-binding transcriptional LysR family regulator n=1 Tax=Pseudonocardia kunmingensis TaxID=630975 RepID=A0A543DNJ1_9PSEU|nr:LysR substrate-binding domain-containing protein [Pseudonocardia kunmingensis]TQM10907.1 DNA-binding transcriptional LysR family regulator [Pseudonocardia kunmingensis]
MELRHLAGFVAVAEELHFGRAAARLHISQSPLSQQIRLLERDLGVELFERSTRSVQLTAAGRAFLEPAREVLASASVARRAARASGRGEVGRVSLGFAGASSAVTLPLLTRAVAAELPGVEMALHGPHYSAETVSRIAEGVLDLGFATVPSSRGLNTRLVRRDPLMLAVADVHPLAARRSVALEELSVERFVAFPAARGSEVRELSVRACLEAGFGPAIVQEAPDSFSLLAMVGAGTGVALVVEAARSIRLDHVVFVPLDGEVPVLPVCLVWRRVDESAVLRAVLDLAERVLPTPD